MYKGNKILLGILAFIVVCVVGYALFSETITVTGTATTQGSFDIVGTCQAGLNSEFIETVTYEFDSNYYETGYRTSNCSFNGDKGTLEVDFEYPGAKRYFTIKLTNNGTIPAIIGKASLEMDDICLDGNCQNNNPGIITDKGFELINMFRNYHIVGVQIGNGPIIPYINITEEQASEFIDINDNPVLKPGNSIFYAVRTEVDERLGNPNGGSFEALATGTISFPFTQITE